MMTPQLRFNEFDGQWERRLLGDILTFKNGVNASKEQYGHGVKFINVLDIINNDFIAYENIIGSVNITATELAKNDVEYGDILFQRSSETREEVGQSNVYLGQQPVSFGGFVIRGRGLVKYDALFFHYALKTDSVRDEITQRSGGSTRYNIGQESLSVVPIVIPSIPEQTKIANFLTTVDEKISQITRKHDLLTQYKKGVMQQIFSQELRFQDDDGLEFAEWEEKQLGDVAEVVMGQSPDSNSYNELAVGLPLVQGNADIENRKTRPRNWTSSPTKLCQVDDIILTVRAPVGAVAMSCHEACIGRGVCVVRGKVKTTTEFIYQLLLWFEPTRWMSLEQGSTFTAISGKDVKTIKIYLPSLAEQTKIANFLTAIDDKITATKTQLEAVKQYKQGLLQQMFV